MAGLTTIRELTRARAAAGRMPECASFELAVEVEADGALAARFAAPRRRPRRLEQVTAASFAATAARLPEALRPWLAVETGEVAARLCGGGGPVLFARRYQIATCRGVVLGVRERAGGGGFASPWTGTLAAAELAGELPVVLAPSAALALVSYALEVAGSGAAPSAGASRSPLTVTDSAASPYPPQHHPFAGDGEVSADRPVLARGVWCERPAAAAKGIDPLFYLLTRPDRALRPLAAAIHFNRRNLAVESACGVARPRGGAVVVDSWRVRVGPRGGRVPFDAQLSCDLPDGGRPAVAGAVALELDPWEVLARVLGACAASAPAIDEDPIEGDNYGRAPELVTDLTLADLRGA